MVRQTVDFEFLRKCILVDLGRYLGSSFTVNYPGIYRTKKKGCIQNVKFNRNLLQIKALYVHFDYIMSSQQVVSFTFFRATTHMRFLFVLVESRNTS